MNTQYSTADVEATRDIYIRLLNIEVNKQIDKLYEQMDNCDDMQLRQKLARKVFKLKQKLL